ncbi:DUF2922 domain-containing protein [Caldibacillus lycopersici]|uniref:DUF2922 domain-containing protein n=1 Tax=Perspicuibacillus lycopersici TaxID=1325689 RepID=A0AAE3LM76_9BACI|nr:DUF2922 domain-containing protein [Perspicuibacillus lycopersici]MCU9612656.1 DUF2922 domain-containing protein [Perspicuibacillus lycopersici]
METNLELVYLATDGKTVRISVNDPKESLTEVEIQQAMESILAANAIMTASGAELASLKEARIVNREVEVFEF